MQQNKKKIDTRKRLNEINNGVKVLIARERELNDRLKKGNLSAIEHIEIMEELMSGFEQVQAYKKEMDEIAKIEILRLKMFGE